MKDSIRKFIPSFLLSWYHLFLAGLGAFLYRFPSKKIKVIGITGTNGKSTVVHLISQILERAGYKTASISSIKFKIGEKEWKNTLKMTMPGRLKIQKFLRKAADSGCQYAVLEVTSEGIKQHRQRFVRFEAAVFTNLTPEHIEAHAGFENYKRAKGKLFQAAKSIHVVNLDDKNAQYFLEFPAKDKYLYRIKDQSRQKVVGSSKILEAEDLEISSKGISFKIQGVFFRLDLLGKFNVYNALAAISLCLSQGISLETCKKALEEIKGIPGRMEIVIKESFTVIVDYAHTPDSLLKVYQTVRKCENAKMICLLGSAGGGRDKWKRPEIGKIACQYCDEIILTNEDPYDEDPEKILEQISSGLSRPIHRIINRRKAIRKALTMAKPGDTVIITGKGCESWICLAGGKKIPWDDRKIVKEEFERISV